MFDDRRQHTRKFRYQNVIRKRFNEKQLGGRQSYQNSLAVCENNKMKQRWEKRERKIKQKRLYAQQRQRRRQQQISSTHRPIEWMMMMGDGMIGTERDRPKFLSVVLNWRWTNYSLKCASFYDRVTNRSLFAIGSNKIEGEKEREKEEDGRGRRAGGGRRKVSYINVISKLISWIVKFELISSVRHSH